MNDEARISEEGVAADASRSRSHFYEVRLPIWLLILTVVTTFWAGLYWADGDASAGPWKIVWGALQFCVPLVAILVSHEMGHYLMARRLGVPVSLPFFIPLPWPFPLGTMGAIIRLRGIPPDRSTLLKIGAAGPLAGALVALPVLALGIKTCTTGPIQSAVAPEGTIVFGDSLASLVMQMLIWPGLAEAGKTLYVSPLYMAGWAGFLITMLNLLPMGQLDGGHVGYAVFGNRLNRIWWLFAGVLAVLGLFGWLGWLIWVGIALLFGRYHFPVPDQSSRLDRSARVMAVACGLLFVVTFMPAPIHVSAGSVFESARAWITSRHDSENSTTPP